MHLASEKNAKVCNSFPGGVECLINDGDNVDYHTSNDNICRIRSSVIMGTSSNSDNNNKNDITTTTTSGNNDCHYHYHHQRHLIGSIKVFLNS